MTMSHLLKQTKKCCVKIIRKFTFNASPSGGGGGGGGGGGSPASSPGGSGGRSMSLNNRVTAKYMLHKNCTPTRCKVQPSRTTDETGTVAGWTTPDDDESPRHGGHRPVPAIPETQNNYKLSRNAKNLPKKRTNITSNKNVNIRKHFRLRKASEGGGDGANATDMAMSNNSSRLLCAKLDKISKSLIGGGRRDEEVGSGAGTGTAATVTTTTTTTTTSFSEGPATMVDVNVATAVAAKISKPLFRTAKHRRSNYNHMEDEDDYEKDTVARLSDGKSPTVAATAAIVAALTAAEELQFAEDDGGCGPSHVGALERLAADGLLFEKVHYDRTKRYLLHTDGARSPSSSSVLSDGSRQSLAEASLEHPQLAQYAAAVRSSGKGDEFVDPWRNYNIAGAGWDKVSKSSWDAVPKGETSTGEQRSERWNPFAELSPERTVRPAVATVGGSFRPGFQVQTDVWETLTSGKQQQQQYELDSDVVWRTTANSSRRTSASTVVSWIEDEVFDNSFNEELERRCATLKI